MDMQASCPECNAVHEDGRACQDDFYTLLGWETQYEGYGVVHHLTVLCFHLQHPSLYSPEGLEYAKGLLVEILEGGKSTGDIRRERRAQVSSANRKWKVTSRKGSKGAYSKPVQWTMTVGDIASENHTRYIPNVNSWAASVLQSLRDSGNLER